MSTYEYGFPMFSGNLVVLSTCGGGDRTYLLPSLLVLIEADKFDI